MAKTTSPSDWAEVIDIVLRITDDSETYDPALAARLIELLSDQTAVIENSPLLGDRKLKIAHLSDIIRFQYERDVATWVEAFALMYNKDQPSDGTQTALVRPTVMRFRNLIRIELWNLKRLWKLPEGGTKPDFLTPYIGFGIGLFTFAAALWILFT